MQVMGGNCGGIIASYVYLSRDGPRYVIGHSILIGFVRYETCEMCASLLSLLTSHSMAFFLSLFMTIWCRRENARRDRVSSETGVRHLTDEQKAQEAELADNAPWFRYTP